MQPVEVPDYSSVLAFVSIALAWAAVVCTLTPALRDGKFAGLIDILHLNFRKHTSGNKMYVAKCGFKPLGKDGLAWECNCGNPHCGDFEKFAKAVGGTDATPPVHPAPNRRAAIAHTKAKS